ncbi:hypothetical protein D3C72_2030520 [compost metagenome]
MGRKVFDVEVGWLGDVGIGAENERLHGSGTGSAGAAKNSSQPNYFTIVKF